MKRLTMLLEAIHGVIKHSVVRRHARAIHSRGDTSESTLMPRLYFMLFGFLFLWHEIAIYFQMDANTACLMTVVVFAWHRVIHAWAGELLGQSQASTAAFFEHGVSWIGFFFWLSPPFFAGLPFTVNLGGWAVLALIGGQARLVCNRRGIEFDKALFRRHSETVVQAMIAFCTIAFLVKQECGSVLPLLGYILLAGLPLRFGWIAAATPTVQQFNASFGTQAMFEEEELSEEI